VSLLLRYYEPSAGQIFLDGVNLNEINLRHLRHQIGIVSQEPVLFSGTIADNVGMGMEKASSFHIETAARLGNAHGFIAALPLVNFNFIWLVNL
jgi:ATP-binding cassette subfamily B (MDR/TAP) protein 1